MPDFSKRSYQKELLDGTSIPFIAIQQNMAELNTINHLLGGHRITLKGLKALVNKDRTKVWRIVEIGCGGGDNLRVIQQWVQRQKINVVLTGIDINSECIAFAKSVKGNKGIQFIQSDYKRAMLKEKPDIIFSSLFCHHFADAELKEQLVWMQKNSTVGFFINDLHRHPLAYYSIKVLTRLFSKSYLVKNDAPLSVLRGFRQQEWIEILSNVGLKKVRCQWAWAFRWLLIYRH